MQVFELPHVVLNIEVAIDVSQRIREVFVTDLAAIEVDRQMLARRRARLITKKLQIDANRAGRSKVCDDGLQLGIKSIKQLLVEREIVRAHAQPTATLRTGIK